MNDNNLNDFLTVEEFAKKYGKDVTSVRKLINSGKIQAIKISRIWLISKDTEYPLDARITSGNYAGKGYYEKYRKPKRDLEKKNNIDKNIDLK